PAFESDAVIAFPTAQIAVMGPEAAINAVYANKIATIEDEEEKKQFIQEKRQEYQDDIDIYRLASEMVVDAIIQQNDLRRELATRFKMYVSKKKFLPKKKHVLNAI